MRILGIESSCDETAFAIVKGEGESVTIEASLVASQAKLHAKYGGVVPEVAARKHTDTLFPLLEELGISRDGEGIDAIAITSGPGLLPALRIGVEFAKTLAYIWEKPLVSVNHLDGHIHSLWLDTENPPAFPNLSLLVSGGHTELVFMKDHGEYELIGMTRDDAAGEAFDKVAKLLGLGYPGGPIVSKLTKEGDREAIAFPRPMLKEKNFDFSFSGLKTAVAVYLKEQGGVEKIDVKNVCASFHAAVVETLVTKTMKAVSAYKPKSVLIAGGVSADWFLRESLGEALEGSEVQLHLPELKHTGDNAAMIAAAGYFKAKKKEFVDPLTLVPDSNMRLV